MRLIIFSAVAIVIAAAIVALTSAAQPLQLPQFIATIVLALAVAIQRINGVQRWLSTPRDRRTEAANALALQGLVDLCREQTVTQEFLDLRIHVWEVPLWYRRLFPFSVRRILKEMIKKRPFSRFATFAIRPSLRRVAVAGLAHRAPTGVKFKKGVGLIGVCLAHNDSSELLTLNTSSAKYKRALRSKSESEWLDFGQETTHSISLDDAQRLARSYGQVIAQVVQDQATGEPIACVTISLKNNSAKATQMVTQPNFKRALSVLALSLANVLA